MTPGDDWIALLRPVALRIWRREEPGNTKYSQVLRRTARFVSEYCIQTASTLIRTGIHQCIYALAIFGAFRGYMYYPTHQWAQLFFISKDIN